MLTPLYSISCDCVLTPLSKHIKTTKYIVLVTIDSVLNDEKCYNNVTSKDITGGHVAIVSIKKFYDWRGKKVKQIEISSLHTNCEPLYRVGDEYVLFLYKSKARFYVRTCSYSEKANNAVDIISRLEKEKFE